MRVLITGVAGFIGQNLAREMIQRGWEVYGIDDLSSGRKEWLPKEVVFKMLNVASPDEPYYSRSIKFDIIVHLASKKIPREGGAYMVLNEGVLGTKNIAMLAAAQGSRLIYLSTSDVYGKNNVWEESANLTMGPPDVARWSYAIQKMWGEQLLYSMSETLDFRIIRLFGSYGPYYALSWTAGPQSVFISQALKKEPATIHGDGKQQRCFQYVDDAIDGIMRVIDSDCKREIFNIGNPNESISIDDMSRMIWRLVNPGEFRPAVYVSPSKLKYEDVPVRIPDISKAKRLLGFNPIVSLEDGLKKTIEWQRTVI